ncbi:MAG: asparagine synthase (glutamine-hydrolyzing), partial [Candidatus Peribacteraceae bacterium]|nr:asparagine synthase (glutamine-hydrolyzing) [Candidatus Peribacteraceae bacterium]
MCGIAGIIEFNGNPDVKRLNEMLNLLSHRGPDNSGVFQNKNTCLGHRRLSIIDLSFKANQPMVYENKAAVVYNGEIYNFLELRKILQDKGYSFKSNSDTETLLLGYLHWGEDIVNRIKGFFSFAIWDMKKQMLFCARDPFGKKPFYYYWNREKFVFPSEVEAVIKGIAFRPEPNYEGLSHYFLKGYFEPGHSAYKNIYTLKAGHILRFDTKRRYLEAHPYFVPKFSLDKVNISYEDALQESERLMEQAVKRRLMADVPLGTLLSGGVDSSLATLFASKMTSEPVSAFTISFKENEFDELPYAEKVANNPNINHMIRNVSDTNLISFLPKLVEAYGEPFGDYSAIPTYQVFKAIKQSLKVVLTGDGGDEVFGGYRGADMYLLREKIQPFAKFFSFLFYGWPDVSLSSKHRLIRQLSHACVAMRFNGADAFYSLYRDSWTKSWRRRLMRKEGWIRCGEDMVERDFRKKYEATGKTDMERYLNLTFERLTELFLVKVDRASMAHSIEVRCPMLDVDLFDFTSKLPAKILFHNNTKKSIPKEILAQKMGKRLAFRKKMGFTPPLNLWLRDKKNIEWM